jgi:hypothetical protein
VRETGARHAHIILRLHVGARRQKRLNHLQVAVLRGEVKRRISILRRRRASTSAPPSAILPRPSGLPTPPHAKCRAQARSLPPSFHPPPTSPSPSESPAARVHRRRRAHPPPSPPTHPRPHACETQRAREWRLATACCATLSRWPAAQHAPAYAAANPARVTTDIQHPASRLTPSPPAYPPSTLWLPRPAVVPHYHPYI